MPRNPLTLAFDIGHSSIGWAVFESQAEESFPKLLGTGTLIFSSDSCLARDRASKRRMRRNIASRRNRIKRLKRFFLQLGLLTPEDTKELSPWPWHLAARTLANLEIKLSWAEIWQIVRWYAHNRGYDGNRLWARDDGETEDTKRVGAAKDLMQEHGTTSMAATICAFLGLDPSEAPESPTLHKRFKGENVAFPREIVEAEVRAILESQSKHHCQCDSTFIETLLSDHRSDPDFDAKLPKRFSQGGLLFGQLTPRFDNRIIGACPLSEGEKKLPSKHSRAFLDYRWAQTIGNLRVSTLSDTVERPLKADERQALTNRAQAVGYFTQSSLRKAIEEITGSDASQLDRMILTEEFEAGLVYDPVKRALLRPLKLRTNFPPTETLEAFWQAVPKPIRKKLFRGKTLSYREIRDQAQAFGVSYPEFDTALAAVVESVTKGKKTKLTTETILDSRISVARIEGRARYSNKLLKKATAWHLDGKDPKAEGGPLYEDHHKAQRALHRPIDKLTNNHLVRHRLKLFKKLLDQLCQQFESEQRETSSVIIEVVKDLQEFSGLSATETAQLLGSKLSQHRRVSKKLEESLHELGMDEKMGAGLIRKARIADDLGSFCPYTHQPYSLPQIISGEMDLDHIVPYSKRPTNSLESLVLTLRGVNEMKSSQTGLEFVRAHQGDRVPGTNQEIVSEKRYLEFVSKLKPQGPSEDDKRRCRRRKQLLTTLNYDRRQGSFTQGDLTQTSHLNKLAARTARSYFGERAAPPTVDHIPGSVTGFARKSWDLMGCLWKATPKIFVDESSPSSGLKLKSEIREITHLHHALDAVSLGFIHLLLPSDGTFREALSNRTNKDEAIARWRRVKMVSFGLNNRPRLNELPDAVKEQIATRLAEKRVVCHLPRTMSGLKVEETTWRIHEVDSDGKATISQRKELARPRVHKPTGTVQRRSCKKESRKKEKANKLLGYYGNKLSALKGAVIINQNFGCALDPNPEIIPFHTVWERLKTIAAQNGGAWPRVLRSGQLIKLSSGKRKGIWRIKSVKASSQKGPIVDMIKPHMIKLKDKDNDSAREVRIVNLLKDGLAILDTNLAGYPCPTTS